MAGDMRETTEVGGVGKLRATGLHALVTACADREGVTARNGPHRCFYLRQRRDTVGHVMRDDLRPPPGICPADPFYRAKGEPAGGETAEARGCESPVAQNIDYGAGALEGAGSSGSTPQRASPSRGTERGQAGGAAGECAGWMARGGGSQLLEPNPARPPDRPAGRH